MVLGVGIDITSMERIRHIYERFGERFLRRILHVEEIRHLEDVKDTFLASRFAAKEAAVKALGTGFAEGITPTQIMIDNNGQGKPQLHLFGVAKSRAEYLGVKYSHISLSHERQFAVALVILEG